MLSENEFHTACKYKNYMLYWVDTKRHKVVKIISRDDILKYSHAYLGYRLYLSEIKKIKD